MSNPTAEKLVGAGFAFFYWHRHQWPIADWELPRVLWSLKNHQGCLRWWSRL